MDARLLPLSTLEIFHRHQDRIVRISPEGEIRWETVARANIRSDSQQVTIRCTDVLVIQGSPARVKGPDNVFGSLDIRANWLAMIQFVEDALGVLLPRFHTNWRVTRVDVTGNYDLGSPSNVKQALNYLRHHEGGRYQVRTNAETVYWSKQSSLRAGKAYAKGAQMRQLVRKGELYLEAADLALLDRLLRLELRLGGQFWRERAERPWYEWSEQDFAEAHRGYFSQFVGDVELAQSDDVLERLKAVVKTEGQALAAFRTWALIRELGVEITRSMLPQSTWYRHKRQLNQVGLSWADFQMRSVVPFRRRMIKLDESVNSWAALRAQAGEGERALAVG